MRISYQGEPGANSHIACETAFPGCEAVACPTFEEALQTVVSGDVTYAMIPIENSVAGRVADIHHLLPRTDVYIIGEHFERVRHQLLVVPGTKAEDLKSVHSHTMALGQCRNVIAEMGLSATPEADTAGAARMISEEKDKSKAAIATSLAAEVYGLEVLRADIEDEDHNTTRFVILSKDPDDAPMEKGVHFITTFIFRVRNVPAALYKALGGFATNGVNMTKLESYQLEGTFNATMFFSDIDGHPEERNVRLALEELAFFSNEVRVLGTYKASDLRNSLIKEAVPTIG